MLRLFYSNLVTLVAPCRSNYEKRITPFLEHVVFATWSLQSLCLQICGQVPQLKLTVTATAILWRFLLSARLFLSIIFWQRILQQKAHSSGSLLFCSVHTCHQVFPCINMLWYVCVSILSRFYLRHATDRFSRITLSSVSALQFNFKFNYICYIFFATPFTYVSSIVYDTAQEFRRNTCCIVYPPH